jgi:hypothetical protein
MGIYPVSVTVKPYRGSDKRKREKYMEKVRLAKKLEEYINTEMEGNEVKKFTYGFIAIDFGVSEAIVRELLSTIDGGHNGVTVCTSAYWDKYFSSQTTEA